MDADLNEHSHEHERGHTHDHAEGASHAHHHVHSEEERRAVTNRLSRAIGHLESVKRMVERGEDCNDVLIQLAAVKSEINNTGKLVLKNHLMECAVEAAQHGDYEYLKEMNEAIDKFIK